MRFLIYISHVVGIEADDIDTAKLYAGNLAPTLRGLGPLGSAAFNATTSDQYDVLAVREASEVCAQEFLDDMKRILQQ